MAADEGGGEAGVRHGSNRTSPRAPEWPGPEREKAPVRGAFSMLTEWEPLAKSLPLHSIGVGAYRDAAHVQALHTVCTKGPWDFDPGARIPGACRPVT